MYAVIKTGGKQYRVQQDDVLPIEKLEAEVGDTVTFDQVMMVGKGDKITLGAPTVKGATVTAEVMDQKRTRKILVFRRRRRKNFRRTNGHRQHQTVVKVTGIKAK